VSHSIGGLSFDDLVGMVDLPAMRREVESRTGDDGVSIFNTGRRGNIFELQSRYAFSTYALARAAEITYASTFTAATVNIVMGGTTFAGTGVQFVVIEVRTRIESIPVYQSTARGVVSPAHIVHATWRIQAVEV
jgi:hypothetical protein